MLQRTLNVPGPVASHLRYAATLAFAAAAAIQTLHLVASGIVTADQSTPPQSRELSRVEQVMRASDANFIQLPIHAVKVEPSPEPAAVATLLAVEIDSAEHADAPAAKEPPAPLAVIAAAVDIPSPGKVRPLKKLQRQAALKRPSPELPAMKPATATATAVLPTGPATQAAPPATLKAAIQATAGAAPKSEPPRRKFARKEPNAGELIRMQLQNMI